MAARVSFRFYAELNDHLPAGRRYKTFAVDVPAGTTVKHQIEALGVPHTEVDLILVGGESAGFGRLLEEGDRVSVYPVFEAFDIGAVTRVRAEPLRELRFVLDAHLGRLAAYLRMAGFDAANTPGAGDAELAEQAAREGRVVLTRDRGLLKRNAVERGYWLRRTEPREQLREVVERFDLRRALRPFTRCLRCNAGLKAVEKREVEGLVPPRVRELHQEFRRCPQCGRVYWPGTHYERMAALVASLGG